MVGSATGGGGVPPGAEGFRGPARPAALAAAVNRSKTGCGGSDVRGARPVPVGSTSQCTPVGIPARNVALSSMLCMWRLVSSLIVPPLASTQTLADARSAVLWGELSEVPSNAKICPVTSSRLAHSWSPSCTVKTQCQHIRSMDRWISSTSLESRGPYVEVSQTRLKIPGMCVLPKKSPMKGVHRLRILSRKRERSHSSVEISRSRVPPSLTNRGSSSSSGSRFRPNSFTKLMWVPSLS